MSFSKNPLQKLLSPHRIIWPILLLEDYAAGLEAPCRMVDSHRDLQSGTFTTGLQHMPGYLGSILRIALAPDPTAAMSPIIQITPILSMYLRTYAISNFCN